MTSKEKDKVIARLAEACREALALLAQTIPPNGLPILPGGTVADSLCSLPVGGYRVRLQLEEAVAKAKSALQPNRDQ